MWLTDHNNKQVKPIYLLSQAAHSALISAARLQSSSYWGLECIIMCVHEFIIALCCHSFVTSTFSDWFITTCSFFASSTVCFWKYCSQKWQLSSHGSLLCLIFFLSLISPSIYPRMRLFIHPPSSSVSPAWRLSAKKLWLWQQKDLRAEPGRRLPLLGPFHSCIN